MSILTIAEVRGGKWGDRDLGVEGVLVWPQRSYRLLLDKCQSNVTRKLTEPQQ